jgi:hypothetical protein
MTKSILIVVVLLTVTLILSACQQRLGGVRDPNYRSEMGNAKLITSANAALSRATEYLKNVNHDISSFDMSKPDIIEEVKIHGKNAWLVAWKSKEPAGRI